MELESDRRLGWQGWLWLAIVAACLAALALGLVFLYDSGQTEGSAAVAPSAAVTVLLTGVDETVPLSQPEREADVEAQRSSGMFPSDSNGPTTSARSSTSSSTLFSSPSPSPTSTSTTAGAVKSTTRSNDATATTSRSSTTRSSTTIRLTATARPTTTSTTTRQATSTESAVKQSSTTTTVRATTQTTKTAVESTIWTGPVAVDDRLAIGEGKEGKPKVLDNDRPGDAPLDKRTLTIIAAPANAESYKVHDDHLHYRAANGFLGTDRIGYRICDVDGRCDTASVFITVG